MNAKRHEKHTYEEYRAAIRLGERQLKRYLEGRWFWVSRAAVGSGLESRGTYRRGAKR